MEFTTGATGSVLLKLRELLKEEYNLQEGVVAQFEYLRRELEPMDAALRKVEEVPRDQLDEEVRLWARDVRELSYDIEDVIDTFLVRVDDGREATAKARRLDQLMDQKMQNLFREGEALRQIANAIENLKKKIPEVANWHGWHTLDSIVATPAAMTPIDPRLRALCTEATELVGIHKRVEELIKMLSEGDNVSKKKLKIVSVVGFGGLGKTTLVRAVKDKIKGDFHCSAFVRVGRNPDVKKVLRDILRDPNMKKYTKVDLTILDERQLINEFREFLEKKRYLIIIDDVWDEKMWEVIRRAFSNGNNLGSRLIMTTRRVSVSKHVALLVMI